MNGECTNFCFLTEQCTFQTRIHYRKCIRDSLFLMLLSHVPLFLMVRFQDSFTLMPISEREKHFQGMQKNNQNMGGLI